LTQPFCTVTAQQSSEEGQRRTTLAHVHAALLNDPTYGKATQQDVARLMKQLPLSPDMRYLQEQSIQLLERLPAVEAQQEAQHIWLQLARLDQQIQAHPEYTRMVTAYRDVVRLHQHHSYAPESHHRVMLPSIALGSGSSGGGDDGDNDTSPPVSLVLERGDIVLIDGTSSGGPIEWSDFLYKYEWGHTGVVEGNDLIYEANHSDGVRFRSFTTFWWKNGNRIWQARAPEEKQHHVVAALDQAYEDYKADGSTPYNFNLIDKVTEDSFYCAQLAWRVYANAGIDIDSNHSKYALYLSIRFQHLGPLFAKLAVAPDEIYLDEDIHEIALVTVE
jgi:hypothetical protein